MTTGINWTSLYKKMENRESNWYFRWPSSQGRLTLINNWAEIYALWLLLKMVADRRILKASRSWGFKIDPGLDKPQETH